MASLLSPPASAASEPSSAPSSAPSSGRAAGGTPAAPAHPGGRWHRPPVGPVWRLVLSGAGDSVAALRWWARWSWWASHRTPRDRLWSLRELAALPLRGVRDARAAMRVHGAEVAERFGVAPWRQLLAMGWLRVRYGRRPLTYYQFQLFRPERWRRAGEYVQVPEGEELLRLLIVRAPHEARVMLADKRQFAAFCRANDLPTVGALAEFAEGRVVAGDATALPPCDLFSKPANWQCGRGVSRWTYAAGPTPDAGRYVGADGRARTAPELAAELAAMSAELGRPILLQRFLRNHPALDPVAPVALSTIRMVTVRPPGQDARLLVGVFRMGSGGAVIDSFDAGGLAARVDPATGALGEAVRKRGGSLVSAVDHHPDTGATIPGLRLPFWPEAMRLVVRAHQALDPRIPVVGWDVALLGDGPLLVEGNSIPCTVGMQMPEGVPLGETPFAAAVAGHLRASFGLGR